MDTGGEGQARRAGGATQMLRRNILASLAAFLAVMALVAGAFYVARGERQLALAQWERRLRVSLAGPMAEVSAWLGEGKRELAEVAANDTVKIYLSELKAAGFDPAAVPHGETQRAFVSSYIVSAGAGGPFAPVRPAAPSGRMAPLASAGLALFDGRGQLVASTPGYRPPAALLAYFTGGPERGGSGPIVLVLGGRPTLVFFRPVRSLQQAGGEPVGYVVGARDAGPSLVEALATPLGADGGRIVLLARAGSRVRYLAASDERNVPPPAQEFSLAGLSGDLVAAGSPGRLQRAPDVSGGDALLFAEAIDASPLVAVASVPAEIALAGVAERERALLTALLLAILAVVAVGVAFNRHQAGIAASRIADAARHETAAVAEREALLKAVVNAHPGALLLVRSGRTVALVSARFAGELGADAGSLAGKPIESVLPAGWCPAVLDLLARRDDTASRRAEFKDAHRRWYSAYVAFLPESLDPQGAALVLVEEITGQVEARDRRAQVYRGVVAILLEAIDQRDPAAGAHSRRTGTLAREIALRMGLTESDVDTAELAGSLQGVGKLFVPESLLRKSENLSGEERQRIDDGAERWLRLLAQISMDYPVATVLRLAHELAFGRHGRAGEEHLLRIAAIVAAANAFVALTSPRAWRPARDSDAALAELSRTLPQIPAAVIEALRRTAEAHAAAV